MIYDMIWIIRLTRVQPQNCFKMDGIKSSDIDHTMLASKTFDRILHLIQQSNLNFVLQVSPFSANIAIKKSLVQDKSGKVRLPPPEPSNDENSKDVIAALIAKNAELENLVTSLRLDLGAASNDSEALFSRIKLLEDKLAKTSVKTSEDKKLNKIMEEKAARTEKLELQVCKLKEETNSLGTELHETKIKLSRQYEKIKEMSELEEKVNNLEEENLKLKDVLYGCCECGLYTCECSDVVNEAEDDDCILPPALQPSSPSTTVSTASQTPAPQQLPPPGTPWTPPPTPPCIMHRLWWYKLWTKSKQSVLWLYSSPR